MDHCRLPKLLDGIGELSLREVEASKYEVGLCGGRLQLRRSHESFPRLLVGPHGLGPPPALLGLLGVQPSLSAAFPSSMLVTALRISCR